MRAPLSIVIPTLNSESELPATLACLMEGLADGLIREVIITDGGSTDTTATIAESAGALWIAGPAGRGGQLRRGAEAAQGEWLLFLHADTHLSPGWAEAARGAIDTPLASRSAGYFRLRFRAKGFWPAFVAAWANLRSRVFKLPYGDQGLLIARPDYDAAGGYDDIPLMEDVALARRLPRVAELDAEAATSAERYAQSGWVRRGARNIWTLTRYFMGADPKRLAQAYRRR
ncbi:TIGR04283 family arsenosugar biosynthesis glycosyltransferase [Shimia ponticola]|uniref:TIGR04283 family arsenosugar biosynthesis glycosyltransferase n=1 Tax=Shimia ponticola TaxID=2582893 RepID=UPI0011BF06B0|nr:TIGR04283 family arsenosugar biosynthesis glycosyltransferase [Shimia ponticola]